MRRVLPGRDGCPRIDRRGTRERRDDTGVLGISKELRQGRAATADAFRTKDARSPEAQAMELVRQHARIVAHFHPDRFGGKPLISLTPVSRGQRMAINLPKRQAPKRHGPVIQWLLDSDPSIRWQVMRDVMGSPAEEVAAERARVSTEGAGARLLTLQAADGRGAVRPGTAGGIPPCTSSCCCARWGSIQLATRHAAQRTLSATG